MLSLEKLKEKIVRILRDRKGGGMRRTELRRAVSCGGGRAQRRFRDAFRELCREGTLLRRNRGRYIIAESTEMVPGTLSVHPRGFGFVEVDGDEDAADVFIPPGNLGGAITGDRVLVCITEPDNERGPAGVVKKILERRFEQITGRLAETRKGLCIRPLRRGLPDSIPLKWTAPGEASPEADPGDWITARLLPQTHAADPLRVEVLHRIGGNSSISDDLDAVVSEYGLADRYSAEEESRASELVAESVEREDCTGLSAVTIDPEDARDFDDALSIADGPSPGSVMVGVHIADVAAFVRAGSEFDRTARERMFTAYLPGRTLHMLPAPLAADRCSLHVDVSRPAHSVFLEISAESGEVLSARRSHTTIRVEKRLTFEETQAIIDGESPADADDDLQKTIVRLAEISRKMRDRRTVKENFLELAAPEVRVVCSEDPSRIQRLVKTRQNAAQILVEEYMLAANSAVARELSERRIPGMYRIHPPPRPGDLDDFVRWLGHVMEKRPGLRSANSRSELNKFFAGIQKSPLFDVVVPAFLSSMQRAGYASGPGNHYGLGKTHYSHFTSPIRRYPDLFVHQQLFAVDTGQGRIAGLGECTETAERSTRVEENNDAAYFAAVDRMKLRYLQGLEDKGELSSMEGVIARVSSSGLGVYIPEAGIIGELSAERLGDERFSVVREGTELRGRDSGRGYRCGNFIYVRIEDIDITKGMLRLRPVGFRL